MRNHKRLALRRETVRVLESELRGVAGGGFTIGPLPTLTKTLGPQPPAPPLPTTLTQPPQQPPNTAPSSVC